MALDLGDLIKRRRAELGMTQARLAELVGMSASAVRSWERGRATPKGASTRAALAAVLGLTDDELQAAIDGADIGFFSDPGRPIASDPTPTIVQPVAEVDAVLDSVSDSEEDSQPVEASDEQHDREGVEIEPAEPPTDSDSDAEPDSASEPLHVSVPETELAGARDAEPELETEVVPALEAVSEIEPAEPEPEPQVETEPQVEAEPELGSDPESEPESGRGRVLVGALAAATRLAERPLSGTRVVSRDSTSTSPAAILAPSPTIEPDPVAQDAWLYRRRLILLGVCVVVLLVVFRWALSGVGDAIAEVMDNLRTGL